MGMGSGGSDELNSEINVTPLVDVMLVLLIIFMITAPLMNTGVDIDLPKVTATEVEDPQGKLIMSIDPTNKIFIGGSPVTWATLKDKLATNERLKAEKALYIEADGKLPYAVVVTAMAVAKEAGVEKVMMLTTPTATLPLADLDKTPPP